MRFVGLLICIIYGNILQSQVQGMVYGIQGKDTVQLPYATILLLESKKGLNADEKGYFILPSVHLPQTLIVSYVGFHVDTIQVDSSCFGKILKIYLQENTLLKEVLIIKDRGGVHIDYLSPFVKETIHQDEFQRAACCNVGESFQTIGSIDVTYSDATLGSKQIKFLGLAGKYVQMLVDNIPYLRGLGSIFSLDFIPSSWINTIQISKGASAVLHGYESFTGQINIELKKPGDAEKFYFNSYISSSARSEFSLNKSFGKPQKGMVFFTYFSRQGLEMDNNKDKFLDEPTFTRSAASFLKQLYLPQKFEIRFGFHGFFDQRSGGQIELFPQQNSLWTSLVANKIGEAFVKIGKNLTTKSIGYIQSFSVHNLKLNFGKKHYEGIQNSLYSAVIFENRISRTQHFFMGLNLFYDRLYQVLNDSSWHEFPATVGMFYQHTADFGSKLTVHLGTRLDYTSREKKFELTPRVHARFAMNSKTIFRMNIGMGSRYPFVIPENLILLTSNRKIKFFDPLVNERAVNMGGAFVRYFTTRKHTFTWSIDYYYTKFLSQVLVDYESDTSFIAVFTLKNATSQAYSLMSHLSMEPSEHLEWRLAFQYNENINPNYHNKLRWQPLVYKFKALATLSLFTKMRKWQIDLTLLYYGKSKLPDRSLFLVDNNLPEFSQPFLTGFCQLTKTWKRCKVYIGIENLTNYTQEKPILAYNKPESNQFESGIIWAPLVGRMYYAGIKWFIF